MLLCPDMDADIVGKVLELSLRGQTNCVLGDAARITEALAPFGIDARASIQMIPHNDVDKDVTEVSNKVRT